MPRGAHTPGSGVQGEQQVVQRVKREIGSGPEQQQGEKDPLPSRRRHTRPPTEGAGSKGGGDGGKG